MITIDVAVAVIINNEGQVLLTQRYSPESPEWHLKWQLPGGGVEKNETVEEACIREAYEETGFHIKLVGTSPFIVKSEYEGRRYLLNGFKAEVVSGTINTEKDIETADAKWFDVSEIGSLKTLKDTYTMVNACNK